MCVSLTMTLRQNPKGVTRSRHRTASFCVELQDRERERQICADWRNSFRLLLQSYCKRNTHKSLKDDI